VDQTEVVIGHCQTSLTAMLTKRSFTSSAINLQSTLILSLVRSWTKVDELENA